MINSLDMKEVSKISYNAELLQYKKQPINCKIYTFLS